MSNRFLTDEELIEATGSSQKSLQKEVLTQNGIFFIERRDGSVKTTWFSYKSSHSSFGSTSRFLAHSGYEL